MFFEAPHRIRRTLQDLHDAAGDIQVVVGRELTKAHEELVKIEMAREAENKSKEELCDLRMKILQELDPFESGAAELQLHHLEHNR